MTYQVIKHYGHEEGLSCCFRQWRAESHCRFIHGYALAFTFTLETDRLDANNWVFDFGGFKLLKEWLKRTFDHKLIVAEDDPAFDHFLQLKTLGMADIVTLKNVGCEKFAELAYLAASSFLDLDNERVHLVSVKVSEHPANHALFAPVHREVAI